MRAQDQRRVPVVAQRLLARADHRPDGDRLAAAAVVAAQIAVLGLRVDDVGVLGIDPGLEAVAADGDVPVVVGDAVGAGGARRTAEGEVVLGAAVDVVERLVVVDGDLVELGDRQVGEELPGGAAVTGLVQAAVTADQQAVGVVRVDPHGVVVDVLGDHRHAAEALAAVLGDVQPGVQGVDPVGVLRVGDDLLVVLGTARDVVAALLPVGAGVGRAEEAAGVAGRLDDGVQQVGIDRRHAPDRCARRRPRAGRCRACASSRRRRSTCGSPTRGRR